ALACRLELREGLGLRLDTQPAPIQEALEEQRVAECLAILCTCVNEHAVAFAAEEILEEKLIEARPGEELHPAPPDREELGNTGVPFDLILRKAYAERVARHTNLRLRNHDPRAAIE